MAEGYTLSEDLKVYEITLRPGVLFHNGKEMTAADVEASLNQGRENLLDVYASLTRRLVALLPVMLIVVSLVFFLGRLIPGDPAAVMAGAQASAEDIEQMRRLLGLDRPLYEQYARWFVRLLSGDLGRSIFLDRPVITALVERLEPTYY